jgi:hypothetical protein
MRLDEEKLEALRSWGERLRQSSGEESAAVGRAIQLLVEEIDRLHIELWHARIQPKGDEPVTAEQTTEGEGEPEPVAASLQARLQGVLRRRGAAEPAEPVASDTESDRTTSPQAWIAAMRRQK